MRVTRLILVAAFAVLASAAQAESVYTDLDLDACDVVETYEGGGADLRCDGYEGWDVWVHDGDARTDVDYGYWNDNFESFSAFNGPGPKIEWMLDAGGTPYAAALRFLIDVDGRKAQALVVSKPGDSEVPGCVIGVVDAAADQANGVARGLGAMAPLFDCASDPVVIVPGASELVSQFNGANNN
ncbi:MAG: hypothetical protein ABIY37_04785 [Devosia sp.]